MTSRPGPELEELIGEAALVRLAEVFGGTRLYVPEAMGAAHEIAQAIGLPAARMLSERFASDYIRVPLAREERARQYRRDGKSNPQIARILGMSESGVGKLFKRTEARSADRQRGSSKRKQARYDDRQRELFDG